VYTRIAEAEREGFLNRVNQWIDMVRSREEPGAEKNELLETIRKFHIPLWPLEAFAKSMVYDIDHNGFRTLQDFLEYSQGASVAPASIFVHLNGLTRINGEYRPPAFDVKKAATPCAIFSYLVHIIRDFQKDQQNNLNYFADDLLQENGLTTSDLSIIATGGPIPSGFRNLIGTYCELADTYRKSTYRIIEEIAPHLEPRYRLSLQIIFNLYLMVYERIDIRNGSFMGEELNPTPAEIRERVRKTIEGFEE
jgi:phytoene/squalene synthetase